MRTTLSISDVVLRELREQAAVSGRSFREVLEQSLEIGLAHLSKPRNRTRFRVHAHKLGLKPGLHGTSLNQFYDQLTAAGTGGNLSTDALIAALAIEHGGCVYSNDRDFARFPDITWRNPLA